MKTKRDIAQERKTAFLYLLLMLLILTILAASEQDYLDAVAYDAHWCNMVESGLWGASEDQYADRCLNNQLTVNNGRE